MQIAVTQRQSCPNVGSNMQPAARLLTGVVRRGPLPVQVFRKYGFQPDKVAPKKSDLTFTDHAAIFEGRPTADLLRALLVLRLCATEPFVRHSEALLDSARRVLGERAAMGLVQDSFYKHFCAGQEAADVWGRMNALRAHGIGAILDYAEEDDLLPHCRPGGKPQQVAAAAAAAATAAAEKPASEGGRKGGRTVSAQDPLGGESIIESRVAARTYDHQDDALIERHTRAFLAAIDTAATLPGQGFAAIKLTALVDPGLLEHLAGAVTSVHLLFRTYDLDGDGFVTREEFDQCYEQLTRLQGLTSSADERSELWDWLDPGNKGRIDYASWAQRLDLRQVPEMAAALERQAAAAGGPARPWGLSDVEKDQLEALVLRLERLVQRALSKGVKLMIDAEQSSLRPAIDHLAHELMRRHNIMLGGEDEGGPGEAVIFTTYQTYLRDAKERLQADLERAQREGYTLGVKLVRGAYLHLERRRAAETGAPSPVWDRIEETTACFDDCLDMLLAAVKEGRAELMIGSHNQASVERCVAGMAALGLQPEEAPVYFGQLMGMADNLSFTLGHHGYKVFKYCPYGSVDKVIPYLLRRVNENQYIMKGGKRDVALLWSEIWRRLLQDPEYSPLARLLVSRSGDTAASPSA